MRSPFCKSKGGYILGENVLSEVDCNKPRLRVGVGVMIGDEEEGCVSFITR